MIGDGARVEHRDVGREPGLEPPFNSLNLADGEFDGRPTAIDNKHYYGYLIGGVNSI